MNRTALLTAVLGVGLGLGIGHVFPRGASDPLEASIETSRAGAEVKRILGAEDPLRRVGELGALLPRLGAESLPAVLEAFENSTVDAGDPELILLGSWWARFDPEGALEWITTDWRADHGVVMASVYRSWAHVDPQAALGAARGVRFPEQRHLCMDAAIAGWDESGQPGLIRFVAAQSDRIVQQNVADVLARRRVIKLGVQGALDWVEALPDEGEMKKVMRRRIASAGIRVDPESILSWAQPLIENETVSGLPRRIGTRWVRSDPEAAMAWLATLPEGSDRDDGVIESYRTWLRRDPVAATAWIEANEIDVWNEPALAVYSRGTWRRDPLATVERLLKITNEDLRYATITWISQRWVAKDREAADAWLQQADLPDDVRRRSYMVRTGAGPRRPKAPAGEDD